MFVTHIIPAHFVQTGHEGYSNYTKTASLPNKVPRYHTGEGDSRATKVYTILKPSDTGSNPLSQRRGSMAVAAPSMKTFNDVVQKLMKSPSTRHRLKQDSMDEPDSAVSKPL